MVDVEMKEPLVSARKKQNNLSITKMPNFKENLNVFIKGNHYHMYIMNSIGWLKKYSIHTGFHFSLTYVIWKMYTHHINDGRYGVH